MENAKWFEDESTTIANYSPANISTLFQRCLLVDAKSPSGTTSNQRCIFQR